MDCACLRSTLEARDENAGVMRALLCYQHVAIGNPTKRSATNRLKDAAPDISQNIEKSHCDTIKLVFLQKY